MWPLSRKAKPKQYLALLGEESLFQETLLRVTQEHAGLEIAAPTIICSLQHKEQVSLQMDAIGITPEAIMLEPEGRDTAVVAGLAAAHIHKIDPDGLALLLPADQHIEDVAEFWACVKAGMSPAKAGNLVTLGIQPTGPETGYGYIQQGEALSGKCYKVAAFREKPPLKVAQSYIDEGGYFWNAGIFLFSATAMLHELSLHAADIHASSLQAYDTIKRDGKFFHLDPEIFGTCRAQSIDYAVMEKTKMSTLVAPVNVGWSDIGSWAALSDMKRENPRDNHLEGDVILSDGTGNYVRSEGPLVAIIGVDDLVVIAADDVVLIMPAERSQDVKKIVAQLKEEKRKSFL